MKINLILLAAGNSKRFNGNKLLEAFKGKPLYTYIFDKVKQIEFNKVIVVTQYDDIKNYALDNGFKVVFNNESYLGISKSIILGIDRSDDADGYMFMVCDQPFVSVNTIKRLIRTFILGDKGIYSVACKDKLGNPTIFSKKYIDELCSLTGDTGGKSIIKKHIDDFGIVEIEDEFELMDIDTREDMSYLKENFHY